MPNSIKYSASVQTIALKKGNLWIGTGDVGKGPSSTTGYYNGVTPAAGGYTIYSYSATQTGNLSYFSAANDAALIAETNRIAGTSYTTAAQCLDYFSGQTDRMACNIDYPAIVTNGLVLNLDAGFTPSYPTTGTTWYDLGPGGGSGSLYNGTTFNSSNGGSIAFDGTNDFGSFPTGNLPSGNSEISFNCWIKWNGTYSTIYGDFIIGYGNDQGPNLVPLIIIRATNKASLEFGSGSGVVNSSTSITSGSWVNISATYDKSFNKIYINGSLDGTTAYSSASIQLSGSNGTNGGIGTIFSVYGNLSTPARYGAFNGNVSLVQIYNRALSASEVLQNYNAIKSRFGL
jgi:hypothetical protein